MNPIMPIALVRRAAKESSATVIQAIPMQTSDAGIIFVGTLSFLTLVPVR
jgi:hypothetical protein